MNHISIVGWEKFQHYKDRSPPWVKLYRETFTTEAWVLGTDISRLVQVASMLLAARYENKIPYRFDLIKKVASLDCNEKQFSESIKHLVETNFLKIQTVTNESNVSLQDASNVLAKCSSEERRDRVEERRGDKNPVEQELDDGGPVERVFEHWRSEYRHPKAVLDPKRRRCIQQALKGYDEATLCQAISGYKLSPHHMGQNDQRTVYDDISLFLRDAEHIDRGLNLARAPPQAAKSAVELARERLRQSVNGHERVVEQAGGAGNGGVGPPARVLR